MPLDISVLTQRLHSLPQLAVGASESHAMAPTTAGTWLGGAPRCLNLLADLENSEKYLDGQGNAEGHRLRMIRSGAAALRIPTAIAWQAPLMAVMVWPPTACRNRCPSLKPPEVQRAGRSNRNLSRRPRAASQWPWCPGHTAAPAIRNGRRSRHFRPDGLHRLFEQRPGQPAVPLLLEST
ncbi:hypothetical protein FQR65_LT20124 [Abscondita terminalis]|nr:hypothetical protein FQR65_LT20124 [Abscondita terminalis]